LLILKSLLAQSSIEHMREPDACFLQWFPHDRGVRIRNKFRACDPAFNEIENCNGFGYCSRKPSDRPAVIQPGALAAGIPEGKRQLGSSAES
jgi:hypothetical protein